MRNVLFYLITVLIWGSTWMGIKMQLGQVDPMVSVFYRFTLASLILLVWCRLRRLPMSYRPAEHGFLLLQGALLFGFNYLLFYLAELHVASGLAAVIFSTIVLMNVINGALFLGSPISGKVIVGGAFGLCGIALVFKNELAGFQLGSDGLVGAGLCVAATMLASLGNIVSARNQKAGLPIVQSNAFGMGYGAAIMLLTSMFFGKSFDFEPSYGYSLSLVYLALFGSVVAFGCYLTLVGNIGADRAAYATLLFPVVALLISTVWEDYHWTVSSALGVLLILFGNLWTMQRRPAAVSLTVGRRARVGAR